ncbi:IclR family transcriptional regulator [Paenibacillus sp. OAS669]|uniref:IclR family transcriptional regulator n=1 Tax=Paenibacillus sp. OAS669 TaxID=2663821 RepID=UPI00178BED07|nr:IclR family transcriptional regulator [Paenibacillus sp. OAS669]MBE1443990.1 DNA-binding IclR family transcriptional regulator [Paenibacillus sp. OAS669]
MDKKYWVPALDRAHRVLREIAEERGRLKLTDLCQRTHVSKSTMFSLLQTMEELGWIEKDAADSYGLGGYFGWLGSAYFQQFNLIDLFKREAPAIMREIGESVQLARLEGTEVVYLAKEAAPTPVQVNSGPGSRFPAHATGLGKVMLAGVDEEMWGRLYPSETPLAQLTPYTIVSIEALKKQVQQARLEGVACDEQEAVMGFCCVAAPIKQPGGEVCGAVSISMPLHEWERKRVLAGTLAVTLAEKLAYGGRD